MKKKHKQNERYSSEWSQLREVICSMLCVTHKLSSHLRINNNILNRSLRTKGMYVKTGDCCYLSRIQLFKQQN